jgi:predicted regulator of Ras-like GTPase activity (Roadblock/LC7/MglB family)
VVGEDVNEVVKNLKSRIGAIAAALISRDGLVLSADVPTGVYTETFAIMCATILGAAATANTELNRSPPNHIIVDGTDSKTLIVGSGKKALLVAVVNHDTETNGALAELSKVAEAVKTG